MPRKPQPWFRFYVETIHDRKIRRIPVAQRWAWPAVLAAARESPEPGRLMIAAGVPMTIAELADYADMPLRAVRAALDLMVELAMITIDDGVITVCNFHFRQFQSDNVTERTRTHRERSKERSNNGRRNTPETETETEHVKLQKGGDRYVPSEPADATNPPACSQHPDGDSDQPCAGCQRVREWRDRNQRASAEAEVRARRQCPDCGGDGWLTDSDGNPAGKCSHPRSRRTA